MEDCNAKKNVNNGGQAQEFRKRNKKIYQELD